MWHFPRLDSFLSASFISRYLNPLLLLLFLGDVDALGHQFTHILEIVISAAFPTPCCDALGLRLLLIAGKAILMSAGVVLDHSRAHGILKDNLLIVICK